MSKETLIERLLILPAEIYAAEGTVLKYDEERRQAARALEDAGDRLLIEGGIEGKNAEGRAAHWRQATLAEQSEVDMAERLVAWAKCQLHRLQNEHSSLRAIARLLATE